VPDTEAGELLQNQGESSITESRCTEEFELNAVIPDPNVIGQWCVIHYDKSVSPDTSSNLYQIQSSTNPQKNRLFPMEHMQLTSADSLSISWIIPGETDLS
jgi:hypothetical protein